MKPSCPVRSWTEESYVFLPAERYDFLSEKPPGRILIFLDLDFGNNEFNGIDLARQIRAVSPGSKIVFVTNHYELALDVLKSGTEPFGFIEKTTDIHKMNRNCYQYLYLANKQLSVHPEEKIRNLFLSAPGSMKKSVFLFRIFCMWKH